MVKFRILAVSFFLLSCAGPALTEEISFHKVAVEPAADTPGQFVADGQRIAIFFQSHSDADAADIDAFPEVPVVIYSKDAEKSCQITEGGIWAREGIYLEPNEQYVLMNEYSGSGSDLVSYDTGTCLEIKRLDVSGLRWDIDGNKARLGDDCSREDMTSCTSFRSLDLNFFVND